MKLSKQPDWAIIIARLNQDQTFKQMAELTGASQSTLCSVASEIIEPLEQWKVAFNLIDAYMRKLGAPLPFYGEHNE
jgi:hypothetical protein